MIISENEKDELIKHRLLQAQETAEVAELLISLNKIPTAINRIYYAIFYCLLAYGLKYGFETSKHMQLIGWFNKSFIAAKKIDSDFGRIVRDCYEYRKSADYDSFVSFENVDVKLLFNEMKSFLTMSKEFLES
ncbi:HEPN domain-containing protein [Draconibacterium sp.]|nr:HEPN domain-containing protein [Draconibacterium sp.]